MDVQELVVRAVPEGVSDTVDGLGEMTDQVEDSTDEMDEQASSMADLSKQFSGAMDVAVAGLAVASGFLLSQVPVLGEAFDGLFAIVDAVAFQMDSVLRPVLSPISDFFIDVANAIFEADGAMGTIIGVIASFVSIAAVVLTTIVGVVKILSVFAGAIATIGGALGTIISVVGAVASALAGLISLPALLIAAFVALAAALIFNVGGIRDKVIDILGDMWDWFVGLASDLASWARDLASDAWDWGTDAMDNLLTAVQDVGSGIWDWFTDLGDDLAGWAGDLASDAFDWGVSLAQGLLDGIVSLTETVVEAFQDVINGIIETINRALDILPEEVTSRVGVESFEQVDFDTDFGSGRGREATNGGGSSGGDFIGSVGGGRGTINLDGRDVENTQGRYRADNLHRRGG